MRSTASIGHKNDNCNNNPPTPTPSTTTTTPTTTTTATTVTPTPTPLPQLIFACRWPASPTAVVPHFRNSLSSWAPSPRAGGGRRRPSASKRPSQRPSQPGPWSAISAVGRTPPGAAQSVGFPKSGRPHPRASRPTGAAPAASGGASIAPPTGCGRGTTPLPPPFHRSSSPSTGGRRERRPSLPLPVKEARAPPVEEA